MAVHCVFQRWSRKSSTVPDGSAATVRNVPWLSSKESNWVLSTLEREREREIWAIYGVRGVDIYTLLTPQPFYLLPFTLRFSLARREDV